MTVANPYRSIRSWVAIRVPSRFSFTLNDKGYSTKTLPAKSSDIAMGHKEPGSRAGLLWQHD